MGKVLYANAQPLLPQQTALSGAQLNESLADIQRNAPVRLSSRLTHLDAIKRSEDDTPHYYLSFAGRGTRRVKTVLTNHTFGG